jgi:replicative DNA helicase
MKKQIDTQPSRIPPHSVEAEEQLLSACLLDGGHTISTCIEHRITPDTFYVPAHALCYQKMVEMYGLSKAVETHTVAEELKKDGNLEKVGGFPFILRVSNSVPTTAGAAFFISKVKELSLLRALIVRGSRIVDKAYNYIGDLSEFASEVEDALRVYGSLDKGKSLASACDDTLALIERIKAGEKTQGLGWPFKGMDERMDVAENGELIVVAARPGRGKSSFARQVAWDWSLKHGDVAYFSREMPVGQLPQLFAQSISGMSWREARRGHMHPHDLATFCEGVREVKKNTRLHVFDKDSTITQVISRIRSLRSKIDLKAVFIDYLQAYDMKQEKGETRDLAIGRFTRCLKDIALDLNIPVILLAQLSRAVEKEEREPRASDLRESGNIEQDADRIVFTHWLPVTPDGIAQDFTDYTVQNVHASFIQVKNRNGSSGKLDVRFHRPTTTFHS